MAFKPQTINPIDLKKSTAVGVSIPFNGSAGGFVSTFTTKDQLKSNLINYFLTNSGERIMNSSFGGNLRQIIFEQINEGTLENVKSIIQQTSARVFPNVVIKDIKVTGDEFHNIFISLTYFIPNTNIADSLTINFSQ